jgi:hypothetical protein
MESPVRGQRAEALPPAPDGSANAVSAAQSNAKGRRNSENMTIDRVFFGYHFP